MDYYHIVLFLLALAVAVTSLAPKIMVPYPILLMIVGIGVGFLPEFRTVPMPSEIVFLVFLPPLLYDAAKNIPFPAFRKNIGIISMLAITMVLITMCAIAVVAYFFVPGMTWPVAFVIGAILSPPDAAAAAAVLNVIRVPARTKTILEGESLVNDASALTAYRIALGVVGGGIFTWWHAAWEFAVIITGGILIGWIFGKAFIFILQKIPFTSTATVTLSLLFPFVAYQAAESLGVSGVLSVVTAGLLISKQIHNKNLYSQQTLEQSKSVWSVIIYMLNGIIFLMIGLEFPQAIREIPNSALLPLTFSAFSIFFIALIVRILVLFERQIRVDRKAKHLMRKDHPDLSKIERLRALDWKNALIVGWSGMRGIVSVATALALPVTLSDGSGFPERNFIIFLTVVVVMLMLVIQGLGLPVLIRKLRIDPNEDTRSLNL